ncbi:MAG TPA: aldo/keto reductase [Elusimicrobiota bacterium]|nr:aldo/keto reductase [Elusimicrobiota bacterium]
MSAQATRLARRALGASGARVCELGFGGWGIGKSMWGRTEDAESLRALRRALERGVDYFDTAHAYGHGHSERLIAQALREAGARAFVATKVPPKNMEWPARASTRLTHAFPPEWIREITERSLRNLRVERLDLQQLHVWTDAWLKDPLWPRTLEEIARLKREGKIGLFGVSINSDDPDSALEAVRAGLVDSVQVIFNLFDQRAAKTLLPLCREKGVGVVVRCPFDEGGLTGQLRPDTRFPPEDFRSHYFGGERLAETCRRADALAAALSGMAESLAAAALKYCLSFPQVSTVIPGMRTAAHVDANAAAADGRYFPPELLAGLEAHAWVRNFYS